MKHAVHVKIGYEEAISAKRDVLECEINSLQMLKNLKSYKKLRKEESLLKSRLKARLKELDSKMGSLENDMPILEETNERFALKSVKKTERISSMRKEKREGASIEQDIMGIKRQLDAIS